MTSERAVLLIADIGGYTEYMGSHRMALAHAEVNTARMLDRIIEAAPGFELIEVEGDAAFLAMPASGAEVDKLLRTAVEMHRAFHVEREYVATNLCPCGGCKETKALKLKFVAHVGDVARQSIRGQNKLVGIDVIVTHRLLKNAVPIPEYVLMTEDLYGAGSGLPAHEISPELEGIGPVSAYYLDVADLEELPPLPKPTWGQRIANTFSAVGKGLPYMLGFRRPRRQR